MRSRKNGIVMVLLLLASLAGMVFVGAEVFQIKKITVLGSDKIVYNDIIRRSGIVYGENIFKLDKDLVVHRLETNPYIKVVSIEENYPDEVVITVKERKASAIIPYLNSYFLIDREGVILEIHSELKNIEYPLVQDMQVRSFIAGKRIVVADEYQLKAMCRVLDAIYQQGIQDEISEIKMGDPRDIYLISRTGIHVRIGQATELDKKLVWMTSEEISRVCDGTIDGILDISVASQPVFHPTEN